MTPPDLDGVVQVAAEAFPNHPEDRACFADRLRLYPAGCRVLANESGAVAGYLVAHPWGLDDAPALNTRVVDLPEMSEVLYLHDLALTHAAQGGGHAKRGLHLAVQTARDAGLERIALIAVNDAAPFWARQGFETRHSKKLTEKLASYGEDAVYMIRAV